LLLPIETDHLGTPRVVSDGNQAIWRWDLITGNASTGGSNAFGDRPANQDPDGNGKSYRFDLRFPGQIHDPETQLNYNYFRDYEPGTGRYVESDPIGLGGGINTYGYVEGNPLDGTDPMGLSPRDVALINRRFGEVVDEMTRNNQRSRHPRWNNFCRYWRIPGCEDYENCEGQTDRTLEELEKLRPQLDDYWTFDVESNFDIKPDWYPGHNWGRGTSSNPEDPSLWFDPRAGRHGTGFCEQCY